MRGLVRELEAGTARSVAFLLPAGVEWALPVYGLALLTAAHPANRGVARVEMTIVTPEQRPLEAFGRSASEVVERLLSERRIRWRSDANPQLGEGGSLELSSDEALAVDRVVALPRLEVPELLRYPSDLPKGSYRRTRLGEQRGSRMSMRRGRDDATDKAGASPPSRPTPWRPPSRAAPGLRWRRSVHADAAGNSPRRRPPSLSPFPHRRRAPSRIRGGRAGRPGNVAGRDQRHTLRAGVMIRAQSPDRPRGCGSAAC
jgi:hypothetical protein